MNENFSRFFLVVSGNMCKNSFKTHVLLLSLNTAIKHMARNVTQMPFCLQVPFLLYADWNMETYGEYVDLSSVFANTLAERSSHFYITVRHRTNAENNGKGQLYHKSYLINIRCAITYSYR